MKWVFCICLLHVKLRFQNSKRKVTQREVRVQTNNIFSPHLKNNFAFIKYSLVFSVMISWLQKYFGMRRTVRSSLLLRIQIQENNYVSYCCYYFISSSSVMPTFQTINVGGSYCGELRGYR